MLISNKIHYFRNFESQKYNIIHHLQKKTQILFNYERYSIRNFELGIAILR